MVVGDLSLSVYFRFIDPETRNTYQHCVKMNVKLPCRQAKQCFDLCQNFEFSMARIVYKLAYAHHK